MAVFHPALAQTLRERKKQHTRRAISDIATRLFAEHGFEEVTLSQIADAAEVSVKTIFNHFGSKEDLYFDRAEEMRDGLVLTIVGRPTGTTVLEAMRALMADNFVPFPGVGWSGLDDPERRDGFRRFVETQDRSPSLRARRLTLAEELGADLMETLSAELDRRPDDPALRSFVAALMATFAARDQVLRAAVTEGLSGRTVRRRVVALVNDAFGRLATAFADVDRPKQ
jgi:AcrR family transcriptional regulator